MTTPQIVIISVLLVTMVMFLWGRWRHDMIAMGAFLVCVVSGLIPVKEAFAGFGHPAVVTLACVLVLGYGLQIFGTVDVIARRFLPKSAGPTVSILSLIGLAALLACFINNVGALAMLMPIAIQMAAKLNMPAGKILMPLSFGSILGGMTTLIGTPPNLIVSAYRETTGLVSFSMFEFTPVGGSVAVLGIIFIGVVGWRLVPERKQDDAGSFDSGSYLSEVRIVEGSKAESKRLYEVEQILDETDAQIVGLIRHDVRLFAPNQRKVLLDGDVLVIEVDPESLPATLSILGLDLEEVVPPIEDKKEAEVNNTILSKRNEGTPFNVIQNEENEENTTNSDEVVFQELIVMQNAALVNRSALDIGLRNRYGINLLALSR